MTSSGPEPTLGRAKALIERAFDARAWFVLLIVFVGLLGIWPESTPEEPESDRLGKRLVEIGQSAPKGGGHFKIGEPYEIDGVRYVPKEDEAYNRTGVASWYGDLFHGRLTSNGEIFDMERLTAAHPTLPLPIFVEVTNLDNDLSAVLRVNDRGPFRHGRVIDVSKRAAEVLGFKRAGTANVRVRYLRKAGLDVDDGFERDYLSVRGYSAYAGTTGPNGMSEVEIAVGPPGPPKLPPLPDRPDRAAIAVALSAPKPADIPAANARGLADLQTTGSIGPTALAAPQGPMIQAGFFKNQANAQRARSMLAEVGPIEIAPIVDRGEIYYRVRVGPFVDGITAAAALSDVADAGYQGAKIIMQN